MITTNNIIVKVHIYQQRGTKEAVQILTWAESHLAGNRVQHVQSEQNIQVDWLNCKDLDEEWLLHSEVFQEIKMTSDGFICNVPEQESSDKICKQCSRGDRWSSSLLAEGTTSCFLSSSNPQQSASQSSTRQNRDHPFGALLAKKAMVFRVSSVDDNKTLETIVPEEYPCYSVAAK